MSKPQKRGSFYPLNHLKREDRDFLKPADFILPLLGIEILADGLAALALRKVPLRLFKVKQNMVTPPILDNKHTSMPSVLVPSQGW